MSELQKCPTCDGRKKIIGMGHIEKKCDPCVGIGWIDKPEEKPLDQPVKKRSGRSRKDVCQNQ
jgi:phage FluMu protein Com